MMSQNPGQSQQASYGQQQYSQPYVQSPYGQPQYSQAQFGQPAFGRSMYGQAQMQYVGVGLRFLALLIDGLAFSVVSVPLTLILQNTLSPILLNQLVYLLFCIYKISMEATMGTTLGKMAVGVRVVKMNGSPIGWKESTVRNLLLIIDEGLIVVGAIFIWASPLRQRLGDRAASTVVVRRS